LLLCSARTAVTLMPGAASTVPPLFMRGSRLSGSTPSVITVLSRSHGPRTATLWCSASAGASAMWSKWPCVTSSTSIFAKPSGCL